MLVDADELTRIVRDKPKRQALTKAELRALIHGFGPNTAQFLVDVGELDETMEYSPDARRMIPVVAMECAEAFKARFVTLGELMATHALHHKQALQILDRAGVLTAFEWKDAECFIFERKATEAAFGAAG